MTEIETTRTARIVELHNEIGGLTRTSLDKAIEVGGLLSEQKAAVAGVSLGTVNADSVHVQNRTKAASKVPDDDTERSPVVQNRTESPGRSISSDGAEVARPLHRDSFKPAARRPPAGTILEPKGKAGGPRGVRVLQSRSDVFLPRVAVKPVRNRVPHNCFLETK